MKFKSELATIDRQRKARGLVPITDDFRVRALARLSKALAAKTWLNRKDEEPFFWVLTPKMKKDYLAMKADVEALRDAPAPQPGDPGYCPF